MKLKKMKKEKSIDVIKTDTKKRRFSIEKIESEIVRYQENIDKFQERKDFYQVLKEEYYGE